MTVDGSPDKEITTEVTQPIIIDLGKQRRKHLKRQKRGEGKLWEEVVDILDEVKLSLGEGADGKTLVPVIMIYRDKPRKNSRNVFPFLPS